jgi:aspartate/glutamate racemase
MIDVTLDEIARRRLTRVGVLGFSGASPLYLDALRARGIGSETIDATEQSRLDAAIRAVMEGGDGKTESETALDVVAGLRARRVEATVLGCTEIPLLLPDDGDARDLINPAALLAEAAVRFAA